jgi:hypothetical protein
MPGAICWRISGRHAFAGSAEGALGGLASMVEGLRNLMKDDPSASSWWMRLALADQEERLKRLQNYKPILPFTDMGITRRTAGRSCRQLREEVNSLLAQARQEAQAFEAEQQKLKPPRNKPRATAAPNFSAINAKSWMKPSINWRPNPPNASPRSTRSWKPREQA